MGSLYHEICDQVLFCIPFQPRLFCESVFYSTISKNTLVLFANWTSSSQKVERNFMQTYVNNLQDSSLSKFIRYHFENNNLETVLYIFKKKYLPKTIKQKTNNNRACLCIELNKCNTTKLGWSIHTAWVVKPNNSPEMTGT